MIVHGPAKLSPQSEAFWPAVFCALFIVFVHVAWWRFGAFDGFVDGDSYTRLVRVLRLVETGEWLDVTLPRAGAPYGVSVHWTRLFDLMLLAIAAPLAMFMDFGRALQWSGTIISPLLHIGFGLALGWAVRPIIGTTAAYLAGALTATQFGVLGFSIIGHADHHMMFPLLAALAVGALCRSSAAKGGGRKDAFWAGVWIAVAFWVGPEALAFLAVCLVAIGLPWLLGEPGSARRNMSLAFGLAITLSVVLVLERGLGGLFEVEYDRVSVVHFSFAALLFGFWVSVRVFAPSNPRRRTAAAAIGIIAVFWSLHLVFPKVLGNPLLDFDPALIPIFDQISEYQSVGGAGRFLLYLGGAVFAVPWIVWRIRDAGSFSAAWAWLLIGLASIVFLLFALSWIRWSLYVSMFVAIAVADMAVRADAAIDRSYRFPARTLIKLPVIVGLIIGPMILGAAILYAEKNQRISPDASVCPIADLAVFLEKPPWNDRSRTIAASANFGGEIMYRTRHRVVATVHHRNGAGILDGYRLFRATDDAARAIVDERRIDILLMCPGSNDDAYLTKDAQSGGLYERLRSGTPPSWLRSIALPDDLAGTVKLFEVVR